MAPESYLVLAAAGGETEVQCRLTRELVQRPLHSRRLLSGVWRACREAHGLRRQSLSELSGILQTVRTGIQ